MKKLLLLLLFIPLVSFGQTGEVRKTYYDSGELKRTQNLVDGLVQGEYKEYYESGELKRTENYVDGLAQGEYYWYRESGRLEMEGYYVDGVELSPYEPN